MEASLLHFCRCYQENRSIIQSIHSKTLAWSSSSSSFKENISWITCRWGFFLVAISFGLFCCGFVFVCCKNLSQVFFPCTFLNKKGFSHLHKNCFGVRVSLLQLQPIFLKNLVEFQNSQVLADIRPRFLSFDENVYSDTDHVLGVSLHVYSFN